MNQCAMAVLPVTAKLARGVITDTMPQFSPIFGVDGVAHYEAMTPLPAAGGVPPAYLVELLFSFKGVKRVEVPEERVHHA